MTPRSRRAGRYQLFYEVKLQDSNQSNYLYFGDNLKVIREHLKDASVDLIYLDPPFNSNSTYNVLFDEPDGAKSTAQITAFEDTWRWGEEAEKNYYEIVVNGPKVVSELITALRAFLAETDMMAYLVMMTPRLLELHRVLKTEGSIYLHCDPTASHYLKLIMDAIFGAENYLNEIVWHYRKWPSGKFTFQRNHDIILYYSKANSRFRVFNQLYMERAPSTLKRFGLSKILSGFDETGQRLPSRTTGEDSEGVRQDDVWEIARVPPIKQLFPTQKPEALLERILLASSNEGSVVLDPFCGCGTAIITAEKLGRHWIGIDITHLAISLIRNRISTEISKVINPIKVIGLPEDFQGAKALALENRHQFEWWAVGVVGGRPANDKRKGADAGLDGVIFFFDDNSGKAKKIIIQVKSGFVSVDMIRDLRGTMERENAIIAAFITLSKPTIAMVKEASSAGIYQPTFFPQFKYSKIQILTIDDIFAGRQLLYPRLADEATFRKGAKRKKTSNTILPTLL